MKEYIIKSSTCLLIYKYYLIDREIIRHRNSDVMYDESNNGYPILKMILKIYQPIRSIQFVYCKNQGIVRQFIIIHNGIVAK